MSTQRQRMVGNPNIRRNEIPILNANMGRLPGMVQNRLRAEDIGRTEKYQASNLAHQNRQYGLAKRSQDFTERSHKESMALKQKAAKMSMGLKVGQFGLGLMSSLGDKTIGGMVNKAGGMFGKSPGMSTTKGLGGVSAGGAFGGAAMGAGLMNMFGGKGGMGKTLLGAGLGAGLGGFFL